MLRFAATVLPDRDSRAWRSKQILHKKVLLAAQEVLGPSVLALPFGSSVNGCGEGTADLDVVLYVPLNMVNSSRGEATSVRSEDANTSSSGARASKKTRKAQSSEARRTLRKVLKKCRRQGLAFEESRLNARVPIISLRTRDRQSSCDVSYQNLLPLYNSWLLRAYVELEPRLAVLALIVKRFAKTLAVASTTNGFISAYSWTLMVVYYLQVCQGLPSLHQVGRESSGATAAGSESPRQQLIDTRFATTVERHSKLSAGLADMLRGFFHFYANSFNWSSEVVSVWRGARGTEAELPFALNARFSAFHIQDPIQLERNLNFALSEARLAHIKKVVVEASKDLDAGAGLPDCMMEGTVAKLPSAWLEDPEVVLRERLCAFAPPYSRPILGCCSGRGVVLEYRKMLVHETICVPPQNDTGQTSMVHFELA